MPRSRFTEGRTLGILKEHKRGGQRLIRAGGTGSAIGRFTREGRVRWSEAVGVVVADGSGGREPSAEDAAAEAVLGNLVPQERRKIRSGLRFGGGGAHDARAQPQRSGGWQADRGGAVGVPYEPTAGSAQSFGRGYASRPGSAAASATAGLRSCCGRRARR